MTDKRIRGLISDAVSLGGMKDFAGIRDYVLAYGDVDPDEFQAVALSAFRLTPQHEVALEEVGEAERTVQMKQRRRDRPQDVGRSRARAQRLREAYEASLGPDLLDLDSIHSWINGGQEKAEPTRRARTQAQPATSRTCLCGCGSPVKSRFSPGHDARLASWLRRLEAGLMEQEEFEAKGVDISLLDTCQECGKPMLPHPTGLGPGCRSASRA